VSATREGLSLDGSEHDGTLGCWVGMTEVEAELRVWCTKGSCHILLFGGAKGS
jgi:hypothetical protein